MKKAKVGLERIKKVLLKDKTGAQEDVIAVLRSDLADLLDSYFELDPHSVKADIEVNDFGSYEVKISARAYRVRGIGVGQSG